MAVTKDDLRINKSFYFREPDLTQVAQRYMVVFEDIADPGRIALKNGFIHDLWKVIMRFNSIVNPMDELEVGLILDIPTKRDINRIREI